MKIVKVLCDKCGAEMKEGGGKLIYNVDTYEIESEDIYLCKDCLKAVFRFAKATLEIPRIKRDGTLRTNGTDWRAKPAKVRKNADRGINKKKSEIDDGKIYALRNAGWTFANIKDELGFDGSEQTIINHYNSYCKLLKTAEEVQDDRKYLDDVEEPDFPEIESMIDEEEEF